MLSIVAICLFDLYWHLVTYVAKVFKDLGCYDWNNTVHDLPPRDFAQVL